MMIHPAHRVVVRSKRMTPSVIHWIGFLCCCWLSATAKAQTEILQDDPLIELSSPLEEVSFDPEAEVPRFKQQALQRVGVQGGTLIPTAGGDLGTSFLEASVRTGVPLGNFQNILGITPSFRVDWLNSQLAIDTPSELYETGLEFFHLRPLGERWKLMAIFRPAIRSDFTTDDKALRLFGLGLLIYEWVPDEWSLSLGAVYLDRADLKVLPAVGLVWTPRPESRFELTFPRSRLAQRIQKNGAASETWAYLSAGIGGNTWAVTRASGETDELSLRDIRLVTGVEKIVAGGGGWFVEAGYAFDRRLEYEASGTEVSLSDGVLLQAGWAY
jgi:hypothetical protein